MSAIYLHIPFCKRLCGYCDFFKSVKLNQLDATLDAMECEIVEQRSFLSDHKINTIYFGGGTPSLLTAVQVERLLKVISENYDLSSLSEVTLEANPDDLTLQYLEALHRVGVNRLSIGVQSFDDDELRFMNRRHTSAQAIDVVRMAQSVGFNNITIDLIFGVEGFGVEVLKRSIDVALSLNVQHISAYHLTLEAGTPFARRVAKGELHAVAEEQSEEEYRIIEEVLTSANFDHYEVSNYAREGFRSQHNSSYWRGVEYLGIGAGAHSFNGQERRFAISYIESYLEGGVGRYEVERLSEVDRYNEFVMTSLRCREGLELLRMQHEFGAKLFAHFELESQKWLLDGDLVLRDGWVFIPTARFLMSDAIIGSLFYV
ncbi:MAG: radical SAM family heme chaperone HemW [Rikenellaceae bacterium]